ncbi:MAG: ribosome biogenesis GTPase Der [Candidatus Peribacteraceae bacterium]|jgi:GTP-binding protein
MAKLPVVAIIGRPNTGKSTLFNSLVRKRVAIVSEVPGTTRDHIASKVEGDGADYLLLDTGGMGGGTTDKDFEEDVHEQSLIALRHADLILFTANGREEITRSDREIAQLLRRKAKRHVPVLLVLNKCDNPELAEEAERLFLELGIGDEVFPVSAISNVGTQDIRKAIARHLKRMHFRKAEEAPEAPSATVPRIAIVGKPNVGKSSLINALMSDTQREESPRLVSDIPGTTRDTTDTVITSEGSQYLFVDTAGLKRHAKSERGIEGFAVLRTIQAIEDADIAVVVLDASGPVSRQDKSIAGLAVEEGKGLIILLNKIDLLKGEERKAKQEEIAYEFRFCKYAPVLSSSAETRENLPKLFNLIQMAHRNRLRRLPTKELQNWLGDHTYGKPVGAVGTAKHITQAKDIPPTFVLFVRNPKEVKVSQLRYLENRLRETFDFAGSPIRWVTKGNHDRE